jgi:hypothetical protein
VNSQLHRCGLKIRQEWASLGRFLDRSDGLPQAMTRAKSQLGGGPPAIDHADVSDEVELRDREARDPERERE